MRLVLHSSLIALITTAGAASADLIGNQNNNHNSAHSFSRSDQYQRQEQYQKQHQGQFQGQSTSVVGAGNTTDVIVEGDSWEKPDKPDVAAYAPDAIASPATAPCYVCGSASGGAAGVFSIGGSICVKDHSCAFGEVARRANSIGDHETAKEALKLMMSIAKADATVAIRQALAEEDKGRVKTGYRPDADDSDAFRFSTGW